MSSSVLICLSFMMVTIGDHHEQEAIPFQGHFTLESSFRFRVISRWNQASVSGSFHVGQDSFNDRMAGSCVCALTVLLVFCSRSR